MPKNCKSALHTWKCDIYTDMHTCSDRHSDTDTWQVSNRLAHKRTASACIYAKKRRRHPANVWNSFKICVAFYIFVGKYLFITHSFVALILSHYPSVPVAIRCMQSKCNGVANYFDDVCLWMQLFVFSPFHQLTFIFTYALGAPDWNPFEWIYAWIVRPRQRQRCSQALGHWKMT